MPGFSFKSKSVSWSIDFFSIQIVFKIFFFIIFSLHSVMHVELPLVMKSAAQMSFFARGIQVSEYAAAGRLTAPDVAVQVIIHSTAEL